MASGSLVALNNFLKSYKFQVNLEGGSDGIIVKGTLIQNNLTNKFAFWSPDKGTPNADLMLCVLDLMNRAFIDVAIVNYNEQLEQYFPHRLGVKKISDTPLMYKLYGSISDGQEDELVAFLKSLPRHKRVIIDMSNFSGMGTMFYDDFEEYCVHRKNIYWLDPSGSALINMYKIGIPYTQVVSKYDL
jgi:hypothetical protein